MSEEVKDFYILDADLRMTKEERMAFHLLDLSYDWVSSLDLTFYEGVEMRQSINTIRGKLRDVIVRRMRSNG